MSILLFPSMLTAGCAAHAERVAERAAPTGIEATIEMLSEEENQQLLAEVFQTVFSEGIVSGIARGAAAGAVESIMTDQIFTPALQADLQRFAGEISRTVAEQAVTGMQEGLVRVHEDRPDLPLPVVGRVETLVDRGVNLATIAAVVLGLIVGVLALALGIMFGRTRHARIASEWRLATALLLVQAVRTAPDGGVNPQAVDDLFNRLQESDRPDSVIHALRERLRHGERHPEPQVISDPAPDIVSADRSR